MQKSISELSGFTDIQKEAFENYLISDEGIVTNSKTGNKIVGTYHGTRGLVINLSSSVNGARIQKQITVHRVVAELFIRKILPGETIVFLDGDKENTSKSNLVYRLTQKAKSEEYSECAKQMKGITKDGRFCNSCGEFKVWEDMGNGTKGSICRSCSSKKGNEYQKKTGYIKKNVKYDTYADKLKNDNPLNVQGFLAFVCTKCGNVFLPVRGKIVNRVQSLKKGWRPKPITCEDCS